MEAELQRLHMALVWRALLTSLSMETQGQGEWNDVDGAVSAVQCMANKALEKLEFVEKAGEAAQKDAVVHDIAITRDDHGEDVGAGRGLATQDIFTFCASASSQVRFEAQALRLIADMIRKERTPLLVRLAREGGIGQQVQHAPSSPLLLPLVAWVRHAALIRAVEEVVAHVSTSYGEIIAEPNRRGGQFHRVKLVPHAQGETQGLVTAWKFVSVPSGETRGVLIAEGATLRWQGKGVHVLGADICIGRKQLGEFVSRVFQSM